MKFSESIKEITAALAKAKKSFKPLVKGKTNPHYKSKYAALEAVLACSADALAENGLVLVQSPDMAGIGADQTPAVVVTNLLAHTSGEWIQTSSIAMPVGRKGEPDLSPQAVGSAITYLRRYGAQSMLGLAAEDDDDGNSTSKNTAQKPKDDPKAKVSPSRADQVISAFESVGTLRKDLIEEFGEPIDWTGETIAKLTKRYQEIKK